tara:strand:- start:435 stop:1154 length:720 start_codon:yes stop_codon:yes gene_type:complete
MEMESLPKNVGIIMDGNRRWALKRGYNSSFGHKAGTKTLKNIVNYSNSINLNELTVFAFSTENRNRSFKEVEALFFLAEWFLTSEIAEINRNNIKLVVVGNRDIDNKKLVKLFEYAEKLTFNNTGLKLNIAFNYGGKSDILHSVKKIVKMVHDKDITENEIDERTIFENLYSSKVSDIDLLIRTGSEKRISNFMPWQLAYSEIFFSKILWPDFTEEDMNKAIEFFIERDRRYGKLQSKL